MKLPESKAATYAALETAMLSFQDYASVAVQPSVEPLVPIIDCDGLTSAQIHADMHRYTGDKVFVRQGVLERLKHAGSLLVAEMTNSQLKVTFGYRALSVQIARFARAKANLSRQYSGAELLEAAHRLIAMSEVAGHPAGAAVDLTIVQCGEILDMGTEVAEFVPDSYTFSPYVSSQARQNRMLLRTVMTASGFAPFDGEWWHFSYGDKEWAKYYDQPAARYEQIEFKAPGLTDV